MNIRMKILKEVGMQADLFREKTEYFGNIATEAFSGSKAQMKNLENIANSALKVSDVLDYIKRQTGKSRGDEKWKTDKFGEKLLKEIKESLRKRRDMICENLQIKSDEQKLEELEELEELEVYLLLIREFVRQIVIFYEFSIER